jgi:hypothetical protein
VFPTSAPYYVAGSPGASDSPGSSDNPSATDSPAASDVPTLYDPGQPIPITVDGNSLGTVAVFATRSSAQPPETATHVAVTVTYVAKDNFPLSVGHWSLLKDDGTIVPLVLQNPHALDGTLKKGAKVEVLLSADLADAPTNIFVVLVDAATSDMVLAIPVE